MSIESAIAQIEQLVALKTASLSTFSATVTSLSGGKVGILRLGSSTADGQLYPRLSGFGLTVGDEVICLNLLGTAFVLGKTQRATAGVLKLDATGFVNPDAIIFDPITADTSSVASTAATGTWQTALSTSIALPAGTWTVTTLVGLTMTRSPAGQANLRGNINGNAGGTRIVNPNINTGTAPNVQGWSTHWQWHRVAGITGGGSVTLLVEFKGDTGTGVTTTAIEPICAPFVRRTA